MSFDLIIYGRDTRKLTNIANKLLQLFQESFELTQSAILLFDTRSSFFEFSVKTQKEQAVTESVSFLVYYLESENFITPYDSDIRLIFFQTVLTHDSGGLISLN